MVDMMTTLCGVIHFQFSRIIFFVGKKMNIQFGQISRLYAVDNAPKGVYRLADSHNTAFVQVKNGLPTGWAFETIREGTRRRKKGFVAISREHGIPHFFTGKDIAFLFLQKLSRATGVTYMLSAIRPKKRPTDPEAEETINPVTTETAAATAS